MSSAASEEVQLNQVTVDHEGGGLVHLEIEVAPQSVRAERDHVMQEYARRLKVPGFRPGRIPPNIVRRNVGDEAIAQRVSEDLVPKAYRTALEQNDLQPLSRAEIGQLTFDAFAGDEPLKFTAHVVVRPAIELGALEGIAVTRPRVDVTEEDIEKALEALRGEHATLKSVEGRGAAEGDIINAELQVFVDGVPRGEEPTRLRAFVLGNSGFVPSIDEHISGAELDEVRRFNVTYPSDYSDAELAGQVAEFEAKITAIKERVLPELNEELLGSLGFENLDAVRERMRTIITEDRGRAAQTEVRDRLTQAATDGATFDLPTALVDRRLHSRMHSLEHELEERNLTLEQYLNEVGKTQEELEADLRAELTAEVRRELVLDEIVRRQELKVSGEEIENHYRMMAAVLQQPIETVIQNFDVNAVQASLLQRKAVDWLLEHASVTEE